MQHTGSQLQALPSFLGISIWFCRDFPSFKRFSVLFFDFWSLAFTQCKFSRAFLSFSTSEDRIKKSPCSLLWKTRKGNIDWKLSCTQLNRSYSNSSSTSHKNLSMLKKKQTDLCSTFIIPDVAKSLSCASPIFSLCFMFRLWEHANDRRRYICSKSAFEDLTDIFQLF